MVATSRLIRSDAVRADDGLVVAVMVDLLIRGGRAAQFSSRSPPVTGVVARVSGRGAG
jgi:hypothetical protein